MSELSTLYLCDKELMHVMFDMSRAATNSENILMQILSKQILEVHPCEIRFWVWFKKVLANTSSITNSLYLLINQEIHMHLKSKQSLKTLFTVVNAN